LVIVRERESGKLSTKYKGQTIPITSKNMKLSEAFEGDNSSLRKAFDEATRDTAPAKDWREEFHELYGIYLARVDQNHCGMSIDESARLFIENLLTTHSAHLVERIESLKKTKETEGVEAETALGMQYRDGFNQALDQAIDIVKDSSQP